MKLSLKELCRNLNSSLVKYSRSYYLESGEKKFPVDVLEIERKDAKTGVSIVYFGSEPTKVYFKADSGDIAQEIITSLKLPSFSENFGEKIFKILNSEINDKKTPVNLEIEILSGKEDKLFLILKKLIHVYSGKIINEEFYSSYKSNLTGINS